MPIPTPSFNPNQPIPNDPFNNDSEEFLIQTGDKMMLSGPIISAKGKGIEIQGDGIIGDIDCGVLGE